jgi:hypothetical protein
MTMRRAARRLIEGRLVLHQRSAVTGQIVAIRRARNTVMRGGAELIAGLFDGSVTSAIDGIAVGLNADPPEPPYETTALTTADGDSTTLLQLPVAKLATDAITTRVDTEAFKLVLSVHGVMPADRAVSPDADIDEVKIGEAALGVLASDGQSLERIYNRVVFEPIPKRRSHELAFFWEIDFPYGT